VIEDQEGACDLIVFKGGVDKFEPLLTEDRIVLVGGDLDRKDDGRPTILVRTVEEFTASQEEIEAANVAADKEAAGITVRVPSEGVPGTVLEDLRDLLAANPGKSPVTLQLPGKDGVRTIRLGDEMRVNVSPGLRSELEGLLGAGSFAQAA
jgi:DNA polymerase III alpha subunit